MMILGKKKANEVEFEILFLILTPVMPGKFTENCTSSRHAKINPTST